MVVFTWIYTTWKVTCEPGSMKIYLWINSGNKNDISITEVECFPSIGMYDPILQENVLDKMSESSSYYKKRVSITVFPLFSIR